jgi:hypothetical protein
MQIAITNRGSNQIQPEIIKQMNNAQRSIWIAVAWFTDREIYNVLIEKLKQGVNVRILAVNDDKNQNINTLIKNGAEVYLIDNKILMHHKYSIIDSKIVITGSYNYTNKAKTQFENVVISVDNIQLIEEYQTEFNYMVETYIKEEAIKYQKNNNSLIECIMNKTEVTDDNIITYQELNPDNIIEYQEKESIRLLLRYGQYYIDKNTQLWQYLFNELTEINFHSQTYNDILELYRQATTQNITVDIEYLMANGTPKIQTMISHLLWEKYSISENWHKMYGISIPEGTDILPNAIYTNILRLKFSVLEKIIAENLAKLLQSKDADEELVILQTHLQLTETKNNIANILGDIQQGVENL